MIEISEINFSDGEEIAAAYAIERDNLRTGWSKVAIKDCEHSVAIKYLVAKSDGIVGICSFVLAFGEGQLINIAVKDVVQRMGIGSMLLETAISMAVQHKAEQFSLEVGAHNAKAIAFYQSHQFDIVGRRKNFYGESQDAICMIRNLTKSKEWTEI